MGAIFTYKMPASLLNGFFLADDAYDAITSARLSLDRIANGLDNTIPSLTFDEAKKILKKYLQRKLNEQQTISDRVMQVLCYNIGNFDDGEDHLQISVLTLLEDKWSNKYFMPLCYSLISNWDATIAKKIREILQHKASGEVQGTMSAFLGADGVESIVKYLCVNGVHVDSAPTLFFMSDIFTKIYFRHVIISYYHRREINKQVIEDISITLSKHNDPITSKIVIPELIIRAHNSKTNNDELRLSQLFKDELIGIAEKHIGSIGDNNVWGSIGGNQGELTKAHQILQQLLIDKIIHEVFSQSRGNNHFEERAEFWSRYTHKIAETIAAFPPGTTCLKIHSQNPNITKKELLGGRNLPFIKVVDPINTNVTNTDGNVAVIMRMHNYTILEFLEVGCAYFYKMGDRVNLNGRQRHMYADVWSMPIDNVVELKADNISQRTQTNRNSQVWNISLKMAHQGNKWYSLFSSWMALNIGKTYIMRWNPGINIGRIEDFSKAMTKDANGFRDKWNIYEWEDARKGDEYYMVRVGGGPNGVVCHGRFLSNPYDDKDLAGTAKKRHYVDISIEDPCDIDKPVITIEMLQSVLPEIEWGLGPSEQLLTEEQAYKLHDAYWKCKSMWE